MQFMKNRPLLNSLSRRIRMGYCLMVTFVALIMLLVALGLADIRQRVSALEAISALADAVLEVRRYEKNWLLYKEDQDFRQNQSQLDKAASLLRAEEAQTAAAPAELRMQLEKELLRYRKVMEEEFAFFKTRHLHAKEEQIRSIGKQLVELSGSMNQSIRSSIDDKLARLSLTGMFFLLAAAAVALILGQQMSVLVVKPLQRIVAYTHSIAQGHRFVGWEDSADLMEIRAVTQAICSMLDVLDKREKQLIQSEKLAAVGTLVAGVAHELNNPLSNASASAQILVEELLESAVPDREKDFLLEMAEQIEEETNRARNIIRSLLEFAHDREMRPQELELSSFLLQTIKLAKGDFPAEVELIFEIFQNGTFFADRQQLQQALINILRNAAQAVEGKGKIHLRAGIEPEIEHVVIEVRDNGPGIAAMDLEKIFDPFYTTKDVGKGSGLGLAVTREIVAKHGGDVAAESEEGHGALFVVRLPVKLPET